MSRGALGAGSRKLALALLVLGAPLLGGCAREEPRVRNVVLISVDTLRPDFLSCYQPELATTPHVERFARDCAVFTDALAQAPSTTISHKSMLYSTYPAVHKTTRDRVPREAVASPIEALQSRGFVTGAIVGGGGLAPEIGFPKGFDSYQVLPKLATGLQLETLRSKSVQWLEEHEDDRFFLFLHMYQPHCPYSPPEEYAADLTGWYTGDLDPEGKCGPEYNAMEMSGEDYRYLQGLYAAEVAYVDNYLGDLFAKLDELELADETLVILTSDHGESLGEREYVGHNLLFDVQLRIPLLIKVPGVPGSRLADPVESVDILPTVFAALDLSPPFPFQGRNLLPRIEGRAAADFTRARFANQGDRTSIHRGPWHLIFGGPNDGTVLYRTDDDPGELVDIADQHGDLVAELQAE